MRKAEARLSLSKCLFWSCDIIPLLLAGCSDVTPPQGAETDLGRGAQDECRNFWNSFTSWQRARRLPWTRRRWWLPQQPGPDVQSRVLRNAAGGRRRVQGRVQRKPGGAGVCWFVSVQGKGTHWQSGWLHVCDDVMTTAVCSPLLQKDNKVSV